MNKLSTQRRAQIVAALVEGVGINSVALMTSVSNNTVLKLLADLGKACKDYQDRTLRNLSCKKLQVDEIWSVCFAKDKNLPEELKGQFGFGSVWTWTAIDADTKLIPCWLVGERSATYAEKFISDLAGRLVHRVQLTSDGHRPYLEAVEKAFGSEIDYSMLIKLYSNPPTGNQTRYSPGVCCGIHKMKIKGNPAAAHVSTSYAERFNLQIRMSMRRFTRLTNAHSKKIDNHIHAFAMFTMFYNFCRIHSTLRVTPAMAAGVSDHVWSLDEMIELLG
jgi:IS1 family transposase